MAGNFQSWLVYQEKNNGEYGKPFSKLFPKSWKPHLHLDRCLGRNMGVTTLDNYERSKPFCHQHPINVTNIKILSSKIIFRNQSSIWCSHEQRSNVFRRLWWWPWHNWPWKHRNGDGEFNILKLFPNYHLIYLIWKNFYF